VSALAILPPRHAALWARCGLAARLAASENVLRGAAPSELLVVVADERAVAGRVLCRFFKDFVCGRDGELVVGALSGSAVWQFACDVGRVAAGLRPVPAGTVALLVAPLTELPVLTALAKAKSLEPRHYLLRRP
jgi:hypothetical protein